MADDLRKPFDVHLKLDNREYDLPMSNYSFIVQDSIFSLYPKGVISFRDKNGLFNEYMAFINGVKLDLIFGTSETTISCPFTIHRNSMPDQTNSMAIGGNTETSLIHHYFSTQTKTSKAFNKEMSQIIDTLSSKYPFTKKNIDSTLNKGIWYQPNVNDAEFMQNYLLPFACSSNNAFSKGTPYYNFIDLNNEFHFKTYKSLFIDEKPIDELYLNLGAGTRDDFLRGASYMIVPTQTSIHDLKEVLRKRIFKLNNDGSLYAEDQNITQYYLDPDKTVPIKWDKNLVTAVMDLIPEDMEDPNTKNNNIGKTIFSMREAFHLDKLIIVCSFNPNYRAGKPISLYVPIISTGTDQMDISLRYSGKYLIETSYHKWDGRRMTTTLVVSRQSVKK